MIVLAWCLDTDGSRDCVVGRPRRPDCNPTSEIARNGPPLQYWEDATVAPKAER